MKKKGNVMEFVVIPVVINNLEPIEYDSATNIIYGCHKQ